MPEPQPSPPNRVVVVDVDIRFPTMVWLMVKSSFAAVIAAFLTSFLWAALAVVMAGLVLGMGALATTALAGLGCGMGALLGSSAQPPPIEAPAPPP